MPPRTSSTLDRAPANGHDIDALSSPAAPLTPVGGRALKQKSRGGIPVRLPGCGEVVLLRRPSLMGMAVKGGRVPNPISAEVLRWIAVNDDILTKLSPEEQIEQYRENASVFVELAALCFVHPRLIADREVADDSDDEIGPGDIADADYRWIVFTFVEGDAAALAPFLEPARTGASAPARNRV